MTNASDRHTRDEWILRVFAENEAKTIPSSALLMSCYLLSSRTFHLFFLTKCWTLHRWFSTERYTSGRHWTLKCWKTIAHDWYNEHLCMLYSDDSISGRYRKIWSRIHSSFSQEAQLIVMNFKRIIFPYRLKSIESHGCMCACVRVCFNSLEFDSLV